MESESTVKIPEAVPFWYENVQQSQLSYSYKKSFAQVQKRRFPNKSTPCLVIETRESATFV